MEQMSRLFTPLDVTITHVVTCIPNEKSFSCLHPCRHPDVRSLDKDSSINTKYADGLLSDYSLDGIYLATYNSCERR